MPPDHRDNRILPLLGYTLLLGCATAALWLACAAVLPSAQSLRQPYGAHGGPAPSFFEPAFRIRAACFGFVNLIALAGVILLVTGLVGKGPARLVSSCRAALAVLSGLVSILSLYLLCSGGVAFILAGREQTYEIMAYKRSLSDFALLEAAQGRYEKARESFQKFQNAKMIEVNNASDFSDAEARERISSLVSLLPNTADTAAKRRILATLSLFRERIRDDSLEARDVPRLATEAGAPSTKSCSGTLQWITANLGKDGWEPVPLFKISQ